ncbi:MAG: hypothetical protein WDA47_06110 [Bacilli bacterium]
MTNSKNIDTFYDLIDEAVMLVYNEVSTSYLQSLVRVVDGLLESLDDKGLTKETISKIEDIYKQIEKTIFSNEDIRIAFSLLAIKGLKDSSFRLDVVTPDSINFIIANIINHFSKDGDILLDLTMGVGNLVSTISNMSENKLKIIGVEQDSVLAEVSRVGCNLLEIDSLIYCNNPVDIKNLNSHIVVGDLDNLDGNEYQIILNQINSLEDDGIFVFLINNDFFFNPKINEFKEMFNGKLYGLIVLPQTMFKDSSKMKSLLIGTKSEINEQMMIVNMPSLSDEDKVIDTINTVNQMIDKLKGMIR